MFAYVLLLTETISEQISPGSTDDTAEVHSYVYRDMRV
jgi:hypothetical protein